MRDVFQIEDLETLKLIAEPTRMAILEHLTEPRSVSELARALDVPRTRLYHHIELLLGKGLIEVVDERRVGALTERRYGPTARVYRPDPARLTGGTRQEQVEAIATLLLDTTRADLVRSLTAERVSLSPGERPRRAAAGRSVALLTPHRAAQLIEELEALVSRFDASHDPGADGAQPFAFTWALYPGSAAIR